MIEGTKELTELVHQLAHSKLEGQSFGEFKASSDDSSLSEYFSLLEEVEAGKLIRLVKKDQQIEYTLDPGNFSLVRRLELNPKPLSLLDRLRGKKMKKTADLSEILSLSKIIRAAEFTPEEKLRREKLFKENESDELKQLEESVLLDISDQEVIERNAQQILEQLKQRKGKKGLVMIVDDSLHKVGNLIGADGFQERLQQNPGYMMSLHFTGSDAIKTYSTLRTLEAGNNHSVIMLIDGFLGIRDIVKKGINVAKITASMSDKNDWPLPYFIGESGDIDPNIKLKETFPDLYLGTIDPLSYLKRQPQIFEAIESKFK